MNRQEYITEQQLEQLIDTYFECRLSRQEEEELRGILLESPLHTQKINECRLEMGMELHLSVPSKSSGKHLSRLRMWLSVAASVAILIAMGWTFFGRPLSSDLPPEGTTIVYIAGKEVKDYADAKRIAEKSQAENMAMMQKMLVEAKSQQSESRKIMMETLKSN